MQSPSTVRVDVIDASHSKANLMKLLSHLAPALGCLAALCCAHAQANLLVNGSFETPAAGFSQPPAAGTLMSRGNPSAGAVAGWTLVNNTDLVRNVFWLGNGNIYGVSSQDGADFLDLTGTSDQFPYAGIEQMVSGLVVGAAYQLTFYVGVDSANPAFAGPVGVTASVDGGATTTTFTTSNPDGAAWTRETLDFVASQATAFIDFLGASAAGGQYIGLDDVDLEAVGTVSLPPTTGTIPEPATVALFALALMAWAFVRCVPRKSDRKASGATLKEVLA
jgi:PEP-CTERM motif